MSEEMSGQPQYQWGSRRMGVEDFLIVMQNTAEDAADFGEPVGPYGFTIVEAAIKRVRQDGLSMDEALIFKKGSSPDNPNWVKRAKVGRSKVNISEANAEYRRRVRAETYGQAAFSHLETWRCKARKATYGIGATAVFDYTYPFRPVYRAQLSLYRSLGVGWGIAQTVEVSSHNRWGTGIRTMSHTSELTGYGLSDAFPTGVPKAWKRELTAAHPDATFPFAQLSPQQIYEVIKRPFTQEDGLEWGRWPS